MIRRAIGNHYWMFTQMEHARFSGELAKHIAGISERTSHLDSLILACAEHDAGWPIHDDAPRVTPQKRPVDVFELPPFLGFPIWTESAKIAAANDAYAGLLVSLHSLGISIFASKHIAISHPELAQDASWRFEMNKFQHAQIELQESLRKELGLRTDIPLEGGLAKESDDPREQELFYNFRIVQAMDQISLCMCCTNPPFDSVGLIAAPGKPCRDHQVRRVDDFVLELDPWPFDRQEIVAPLTYRSVPQLDYHDDDHFRETYFAAELKTVDARVCQKGSIPCR